MRDAKGLETLDGVEYVASVPKDEVIVGMEVHENKVYIATKNHVYVLVDDKRLDKVL
jgi:hypothetical protein